MSSSRLLYGVKQKIVPLLAGVLLSLALLASLGAGPDEPTAANLNDYWEVFEGHAYADNRAAPNGVDLVACLGGCEGGYVTPAVITGDDGIYRIKVTPGQLQPDGRMVTFWLVAGVDRVQADQDVLFRGNGETRVLDLNFADLPAVTDDAATRSGPSAATTDLTVPSASQLGLLPGDNPQGFIGNSVRAGEIPLLPGFVIVLGLLLGVIGASLLVYRRRLAWQ